MQWSTIVVTVLLSGWYMWTAWRSKSRPVAVKPTTQPV
jgi:hypothetical protein